MEEAFLLENIDQSVLRNGVLCGTAVGILNDVDRLAAQERMSAGPWIDAADAGGDLSRWLREVDRAVGLGQHRSVGPGWGKVPGQGQQRALELLAPGRLPGPLLVSDALQVHDAIRPYHAKMLSPDAYN